MVNRSPSVDHFTKGYKFDRVTLSKEPFHNLDNLRGAVIRIHQLEINKQAQTEQLTQWWNAYSSYVQVKDITWAKVPH